MEITLEFQEPHLKIVTICVDGSPWRKVYKSLFYKELMNLLNKCEKGAFFFEFEVLEKKLSRSFAIKVLATRSLFSGELKKKLMERGISPEIAEITVAYCVEKGFIDDLRQQEQFIESARRKGFGNRGILHLLKQKNRTDDFQVLPLLSSDESEKEALRRLIDKLSRRGDLRDPGIKRKLIAKLLRRGFSFDLVALCINEQLAIYS